MKKVLVFISVLIISFTLIAQENVDLSASNWDMTKAKMFFEDNQINEALDVYFELYEKYPQNDLLNIRIAECYFQLMDYQKCYEYLSMADNENPNSEYRTEIDFWLGRYFHKTNNFEQAIVYYSKVKSGAERHDSTVVKNYIAQANTGKTLVKTSNKYAIVNPGKNINSEFNEIFPVFSWREQKLFITSDRNVAENQEQNPITKLYKYSVFEAYFDENMNLKPSSLLDEVFSNAKDYILTSVGLNDLIYILYRHTPENKDGGELYIVELENELDVGEPVNFGTTVNTMRYEGSGSFDFINSELYFVTNNNNKKGEGKDVFYTIYRRNSFSNSLIINDFNTDFDENSVYVHPGGDFIVFSSDSESSMGGYDLFISVKGGKKWSAPVNMGTPFNSVENEMNFTLSVDGKYAFISSDRPGGEGRMDIYRVDFEDYFKNNFGYVPGLTIVNGQVSADDGSDIVTSIAISGDSKDCFSQKIDTDSEGYFTFVLKPGQKYTIEVKQNPFETYESVIDLRDNDKSVMELDIELESKE
jgi:hypothetical protein